MMPTNDATTQVVVLNQEAISKQPSETFTDTRCGRGMSWQTLISASKTPTNSLTSGIVTCAPGHSILCAHQHQHAELYHFISGEGVVEVDGVEHGARQGSVVFIPGDSEHAVRNLSLTEGLRWLYVFAADDFGEVKYRFRHEREVATVGERTTKAKL